jgi:prolyl-tRNA editing enzyme YbaK/EbsC (Cys-tRNA(Pro) deacylase)
VEVGAEPPFGKPYGLRTLVDEHLAACDTITFNAGSHARAVQMPYDEYARLAEAEVLDFCAHA